METSYDSILKSVKTYMEQNGAKDVEGELNKVREIERHLQAINQVILNPEQRPEDQSQGLEAVRNACKSVAYGDYLPAKAEAAALNELVNKINNGNLPETIRSQGIEIKGYVDDIRGQLERVDNVVNELAKKLKGLEEKQYKISEVENTDMKMTTLKVQSDLKKCEDIQTRAGQALKQLDSDAMAYNQRQKKAAWIKVGCAAVAGVGAGAITAGAAAVALAAGAVTTASGVSVAGAGGGAILGGAFGGYYTHSYFRKYEEIKTETQNLRSALDYLSSQQKTLQEDNELVKQQMELLNVVSD